jgi:hypothetical protein
MQCIPRGNDVLAHKLIAKIPGALTILKEVDEKVRLSIADGRAADD